MREEIKMAVGLILMLVGVAWYFVKVPVLTGTLASGGLVPFWRSFLVLFAASFGLIVLFAGLLLAWMSYEDYKLKEV